MAYFMYTIKYNTGAGESGKSTVLKQMQIIHKKGFTTEQKKTYTILVLSKLIKVIICMQLTQ